MEATRLADATACVRAYQKALFASAEEESVFSALLPKVANIRTTAFSASSMLGNLGNPPSANLAIPGQSFNLSPSQVINPGDWQEVLNQCIPCGDRLNFPGQLIELIPLRFLEDLLRLLDQLLGQLDQLINLLNSGSVYNDLCQLYKFFVDFVCIPDLQRIIALLGAMLFRMSVNLAMGLDVLKMLVQPIFLPIFVNITSLLHQFVSLIVAPIECIVNAIDLQLEKLDVTKGLSTEQVQAIADTATQPGLTGFQTHVTVQKDTGIDDIQGALHSGLFELKGFLYKGTRDIEALLESYIGEINKFVDEVHGDANFFDTQLEKLKIIRLINFIMAVIQILAKGFECNDPPKATTQEFAAFLQEFFSPARDITVATDPDTGETNLVLNNADIKIALTPKDVSSQTDNTSGGLSGVRILTPTGNSTIDQSITKIVNRASTPVTIKPRCTFNTNDNARVGKWIEELNNTGD